MFCARGEGSYLYEIAGVLRRLGGAAEGAFGSWVLRTRSWGGSGVLRESTMS